MNGSITDAAVKTKTLSEDFKLLRLPVVAFPLEAGKIIPEADSIVLPELQKQNSIVSLQVTHPQKFNRNLLQLIRHISNYVSIKQARIHAYITDQ